MTYVLGLGEKVFNSCFLLHCSESMSHGHELGQLSAKRPLACNVFVEDFLRLHSYFQNVAF